MATARFFESHFKNQNHSENGNIKIRNKLKTLHIHNNLGFATYRRMMRLINRFRWPPIIRYTSYEAIIGDLRRPKRAEFRDKVLFLLYSNSSLIIVHICCSLSSLDDVEKKEKDHHYLTEKSVIVESNGRQPAFDSWCARFPSVGDARNQSCVCGR